MRDRVYLDWNATALLRDEARAAMTAAFDVVGNPSSVHAEGRAAREVVEAAREQVASLVGASAADLVFTSGGSEANALVLCPTRQPDETASCPRLLVTAIEHPSVLCGGRFPPEAVEIVPVTPTGVVDLAHLEARLAELKTEGVQPLVSIMAANNETGALQPVRSAAELVHAAGGRLHVDAIQAVGKIPIDIKAMGADFMTISAHKLGGPKGIGALVRADETIAWPAPLIRGGGQERGARAGTENVAAIAGFGAASISVRNEWPTERNRMLALRMRLEAGIGAATPDAVIFGDKVERLPNTTMVALPDARAETLLIALDLEGIAVSSGSACSSGKVTPSHVLAAMGVGADLAAGALRVSLGWTTTEGEVDRFLEAWRTLVSRLNNASKKERRGLAARSSEVNSGAGTTP